MSDDFGGPVNGRPDTPEAILSEILEVLEDILDTLSDEHTNASKLDEIKEILLRMERGQARV